MALVFRFPTYHPCSDYNRAPRSYDFFHDLWREIAQAYEQQEGNSCCQQRNERPHQGSIKIATVQLNQYKPEEISLEVDSENVTLHGQHRSEREDGFETSEFRRVLKLPQGVDPTTVTSRATQDGGALVIEGTKREEKKADDGKFEAKLDFSGFKPEEIKIQQRGNELTITGKHTSEDGEFHLSRDYSRRLLLPDDVDLSSVTSRLSKEGLLAIEASRDPALLPRERTVDVTMEKDEADEAKQTESAEEGETGN
ncbi:hypothetical protein OS493_020248 [Desmophyllum pertusum]|uniref:SHSP domain-containing protein n=1 Tax=Desmophyllum pertusum TaxID=174260 RepID=A0A9W9ZN10_9CNID|nr:hypothetical protein OS493_020248 [Desmophyllum pertusum]